MERDGGGDSRWLFFGLAALGVVGLGTVLLYLVARQVIGLFGQQGSVQGLGEAPGSLYLSEPAQLALPAPRSQRPSTSETLALGDYPSAVAVAFPDAATDVVLRAVSPPGEFAIAGTSSARVGQATRSAPSGGIFLVPVAGTPQRYRLRPGEILYAKGTVDGVILSVTSAEARA